MNINKIPFILYPRFWKAKCLINECEKEFETMKELSDHCHEEHTVAEEIDNPLVFHCGFGGGKHPCRLVFGDLKDLTYHRGIAHFDGANFHCDKCHFGNIGGVQMKQFQ